MLKRCVWLLAVLLCLSGVFLARASEESDVYFNAGMENYLQGRFGESVENLEKAQKLDPANKKINEFTTKILLEAATQNHLSRNYRKALEYLEKAIKISPENIRVQEMYRMTNELLGTAKGKDTPMGIKLINPDIAAAVPRPGQPREGKQPAAVRAEATVRKANPLQEAPSQAVNSNQKIYLPRWVANVFVAGGLLLLLFVILFAVKAAALSELAAKLAQADDSLKGLNADKNTLTTELEKMKERVKYEHQAAEQYRIELKDRTRKEDERLRSELDLRTHQVEEKVRSELYGNQLSDALLQRHAKLLDNDEFGSTALETARERISLMAENLHDFSPGQALDFLERMIANENPLVRSNVARALARIATPETIAMLFNLYADADYGVKREALKGFKQLHQRIAVNSLKLEPETERKIKTLITEEKSRGEWII